MLLCNHLTASILFQATVVTCKECFVKNPLDKIQCIACNSLLKSTTANAATIPLVCDTPVITSAPGDARFTFGVTSDPLGGTNAGAINAYGANPFTFGVKSNPLYNTTEATNDTSGDNPFKFGIISDALGAATRLSLC